MDFSFALRALGAVVPVYLVILLGFGVRRLGWVKLEADSSFMRFAIDVAIPCFIVYNLLGNDKLANVGFALGTISIGLVGMAGCILLAWTVARLLGLKVGDGQRTFAVTTGVGNYGFYIISMVVLLYPDSRDLVGLILTHNVGCDIVYWSLGFLLISQSSRFSLRMFIKGPIIAVVLALLLVWTGGGDYVPKFVKSTLQIVGNCAIPLNLFMFGCLLSDFWGFRDFKPRVVSAAVGVRMFIIPAVYISAAYFLPLDTSLKMLLIFEGVAPCGVTSAVLAKHFGGHPQLSVQITVATSVVALVALPLYLAFGLGLIGVV